MRRRSATALAAAALFVIARPAVAQQDRLQAAVSAVMSIQDSMRPGTSPDLPTTGVGGTAFGVSGEFGGLLTDHVGLTVEASFPARFEAVQETNYSFSFRTRNRHRDVTVSGLFHFNIPSAGPLRASIVAGPTVVREDTLQQTAYQVGPFGTYPIVFGPYSDETSLTRWTVGVTGGLDLGLQISRHVQIVPQGRVHFIERDRSFDNGGSSTILGLSRVVFRPAVGLRATW